eukprot:CAMPEP_0181057996 /NCGR_PEP_ID=MMETSP1070-20121207/20561_1 /TAXON_ID=265543 /ORGANISM="Minutocellus polymorphus, Strain NH13" /LENGTH=45 /DNA_ID= /DNA_START= /DNA_END= /DNA_ORIENTATION=
MKVRNVRNDRIGCAIKKWEFSIASLPLPIYLKMLSNRNIKWASAH